MVFRVQESEDNKLWTTVKQISSVRDCYMEQLSYEEIFKLNKSKNTFEWEIKQGTRSFYYRILDRAGGIVLKKSEKFDPRTSRYR